MNDNKNESTLTICTKVVAGIFFFFYAASERRVENTRVHFGEDSPVSVNRQEPRSAFIAIING